MLKISGQFGALFLINGINAALEDDDISVFYLALKDVADAWGGIGKVAEASSLNRQSLYRSLSKEGKS